MKSILIKNTCLSILILFFIFACNEKPSGNQKPPTSKQVEKPVSSSNSFLYINDSTNVQLVEIISENNGNTRVNTKNETFFGERKGDKLKYYDQQDNFRFEIKYKDSSFKLRDRQSQLLWKVKQYDNKIKLSNSEEMANPIEIKLKNAQKIVIYRNGEEVQTIRIDPDKTPLNISNAFFTTGFKNNYHAGILNLDELSAIEKYLLIAELNR